MKRIVMVILVVAMLVAIVAASLEEGGKEKGTPVYLEEAEERPITQRVKASGRIDPRVKVDISAHVIAKIERLYAEEGDEIRAGAPFLQLERQAFQAVYDRAAAQLEIRRSALRQAEIELADHTRKLDRARRLHEEGIQALGLFQSAELTFSLAEVRMDQAKEAVRQASADLAKAEDDLSKTTIFAPLSGRVISLQAEEGEVVISGTINNPASVIGTIADLSEILAEIDVDETEVVRVAVGQPAIVEVDALPDVEFAGKVAEIASSGFPRRQQPDVIFFKVKVLLDEPGPELRPGMSASADIEVMKRESALVVPIQAVVSRPPWADGEEDEDADEIDVVFVYDEDGRAEQRPVEVGISDTTHVEIHSGIVTGERVVTGPYRTLRDLTAGDRISDKERASDKKKGRGVKSDEDSAEESEAS